MHGDDNHDELYCVRVCVCVCVVTCLALAVSGPIDVRLAPQKRHRDVFVTRRMKKRDNSQWPTSKKYRGCLVSYIYIYIWMYNIFSECIYTNYMYVRIKWAHPPARRRPCQSSVTHSGLKVHFSTMAEESIDFKHVARCCGLMHTRVFKNAYIMIWL